LCGVVVVYRRRRWSDGGAAGSSSGASQRDCALVGRRRGARQLEPGCAQLQLAWSSRALHGRVPDGRSVGATHRRPAQHVVRLADGVSWRHLPVPSAHLPARASTCCWRHVRPQSPQSRRQPSARRSVALQPALCRASLTLPQVLSHRMMRRRSSVQRVRQRIRCERSYAHVATTRRIRFDKVVIS